MDFEPCNPSLSRPSLPPQQPAVEMAPSDSAASDREKFVSWLFLIGSLMFLVDSILENLEGVSMSSLLHISASLVFTVGSVLFIPTSPKP
ncbi:hypothetical protein [Oscillatoria sp. CS-180]|uniref:hypothetical protein n=1 Tax=Oscillatoria sp. CS-180 TaxID=3021720 RepID=UPI002331115E|nr:hypothetical protein [Oscillatoria sp. CS-180]